MLKTHTKPVILTRQLAEKGPVLIKKRTFDTSSNVAKQLLKDKSRIIEWGFLLILLFSAAFLRLYRIADYMTFLGDEGRDVLVVKHMIVDHKFTLLGPTASVGGFFLGPIYYYFMAPFLWIFKLNPVGPAVMVAIFGIATVFLVYYVGKLFFGKIAASAAILYALSPLVIAYSRSSWNPNLMPFFSLLTILVSWWAVIKNHWSLLFIVGVFFGILLQLHYLASFLFLIIIIFLVSEGRLRKIPEYFKLVLGFIAGLSPFLLFEVRHNFPNTQSLIRFLLSSKETGFTGQKFLPTISDVFYRLFLRLVANNDQLGAIVAIGVSLIALLYLVNRIKSRTSNKTVILTPSPSRGKDTVGAKRGFDISSEDRTQSTTAKIIIFWLFVGVLLFGFYRKGIYEYYFGFMFPLPFLLVGLGLSIVFHIRMIGKIISTALLLYLIVININGISFKYEPNRQLAQTEEAAKVIFDEAKGKPMNFALITGANSDHAYRYFLEIWGNAPITIENTQNDPERKTVTDQLFIVCEVKDCKPLGHPLWEIAGFGRAEIAGSWQARGVKIVKLIHYQGSK